VSFSVDAGRIEWPPHPDGRSRWPPPSAGRHCGCLCPPAGSWLLESAAAGHDDPGWRSGTSRAPPGGWQGAVTAPAGRAPSVAL